MSEMQLQAPPVPGPIAAVPDVTGPALPEPVGLRPATMPQRFARYPK